MIMPESTLSTTAEQNNGTIAASAQFCEDKPMNKELPTKEMERILTTSNPYLTGGPTRWPMPEQPAKLKTEASHVTVMEASKVKPQRESIK